MEAKYITSTLKDLRVTGILFLLCLLIPTLNWVFVFSSFLSFENIPEKELLFRFNIINQVVSAICILLLGFFLHQILKQISNRLSGLAYAFKIFEAGITLILALFYHIVFSMIKSGRLEVSVLLELTENYISYTTLPGIFLGLSMLLFSILFYRSTFIPGWLAILGIISYLLVILYDGAVILIPNPGLLVQVAGSAPVCLFQVITGFYLIFNK